MTEDYKKNLLDYVIGNIQEGTPTVDEIIKEIVEKDRTGWPYNKILPNGWVDFHYEDIIQDKNNGTLILYGGYRGQNSTGINNEVYGIITILDDNFVPITSIFQYDDGTKLRYIQRMNQADDGTYYMIDDTIFAFSWSDTILTSTKRFIMLNNFTNPINNEYKLVLRQSYTFPSGYNTFKCENIQKNPTQSQYVMTGERYEDAPNSYYTVSTIEFNIPYGESPTWAITNVITYNNSSPKVQGIYGCSFISFNEDKYSVKMICDYNHGDSTPLTKDIVYYYKSFDSNTYTSKTIISASAIPIPRQHLEKIATFISEDKGYFILSNLEATTSGSQNLKIELWEYIISEDITNLIYEKSYGTAVADHNEQIYLYTNQGKLYIQQVIKKGNDIADYYIQRYEGNWNPILVGEDKPYRWDQRAMYTGNKFNLVEIFLYPSNPRSTTWYFAIAKEIYNQTQYNGQPYESKDSLCPLYANLYSNGSVIFSRNLYNISKQNNMTNSSVEIPNTYLNNITISTNDLISETNLQMVSDNTSWNKNIYEVVDLNFLNTISVIDEDTNTTYLDSAIKVNNAVTDGGDTNYQNTPCNKFRINYTDNTTSIKSLYWSSIDDTHKETIISFYVDKAIVSIDFISNDETTIYLNLPIEVEIGKYYSISQKVRID